MIGLAALLAGREKPAVRRWSGGLGPDEVRDVVEQAGWQFAYVDGWHAGASRLDVLTALGTALDFGAYYGRNLDALADCLRDVAAERGTLLLWDGWSLLAEADERGFAAVLHVLSERCADSFASPFVVLLRGGGTGAEDVAPAS